MKLVLYILPLLVRKSQYHPIKDSVMTLRILTLPRCYQNNTKDEEQNLRITGCFTLRSVFEMITDKKLTWRESPQGFELARKGFVG